MTSGCGCGATVWLTGPPGAGKSRVARALARRLRAEGHRVEVLDGEEIRAFLGDVPRVGMVAQVLARNGVLALVPVVAPSAESRAAVRERHVKGGTQYFEIHVDPGAGAGGGYEPPAEPDLRLAVGGSTPEQAAGRVHAVLASHGLV